MVYFPLSMHIPPGSYQVQNRVSVQSRRMQNFIIPEILFTFVFFWKKGEGGENVWEEAVIIPGGT